MDELPSVHNFISILQKCRKEKNLAYAKHLHARVCNNGLEAHRIVGNYVVPMFVECNSVFDAQQVFNRLIHRNEHSWTSLLLGYIQCGQSQHALHLYQRMQHDSVFPSRFTLTALLKACTRLKDMERGQQIHSHIRQNGFERDLFVGNTLVDMYSKCGCLLEARHIFDNLPDRDVVSWNALITGYVEHGPGEEALECFTRMQLEGVLPNAVTYICVLKACGTFGFVDKGRELHRQIRQNELERDLIVGNTLINMYAKCGSISEAQEVFDKMPFRGVVSWSALISGYAEHGSGQDALNCFEQMQLAGISPDAITFVCILNACGNIGAIDKGREVHMEILRSGFARDLFVGNSLVHMYAKCGSPSEARKVFDTLPVRDSVSWNTIITGYTDLGFGQEALKCFEQMRSEGISPNALTFVCILKVCGRTGALDKGREMHMEIIERGYEGDLYVGNTLVDMYAKCGSLSEARNVFDKVSVRDVVSWNALIAGYADHGPGQEALKCYEQMQLEGISPNAITFICVLKACSSIRAIDKGREIHSEVTREGLIDLFLGNTVIDMYTKCGSLKEAQEAFHKLPVRDVVSWSALIAGYAEHGPHWDALKCFEQMEQEGISPDAVTFVGVLKACGSLGAIDRGREVHMEITQKGFGRDIFLGNALIDLYAKCGSLSEAQHVFDQMPVRDVVSWSALIAGYAEHGPGQGALKYFELMQFEGISPDPITFVCTLKACGSIGDRAKGQEVHMEIRRRGLEQHLSVGNALVGMYAKCGSLSEAHEVFDRLPVRNVMLWTALIAGYAEHGPGQEALKCFEQMQLEGVSPDAFTFACTLKACGSIGAIDRGREMHTEIVHKGIERDLSVCNALINMYAKCGSLPEARKVFDNLPIRDVVSWSAMINGYGMNHEGIMAVKCFEDMQEQGVKPNAITFTCLLTACSRARLVFRAQQYFKAMMEEYGIVPTIEHYTCMVDLLARSGYLNEAEKSLESMPCRPSIETWTALLSACKSYAEAELGLRCFQQLVQMNPENAAPYILMENIYAIAGRKNESFKIEELRKLAKANKRPASALIEVSKRVYEFVVGNNQSKEITAMLEVLSSHMKEEGHVPNLGLISRSISDEEKEFALCEHAEKLAVAFGLLNTSQGQTLHVTKNMRMCNNCHDANKIISRIEGRTIIVRDSYCVHHFKDGLCSCTVVF